MTTAELVSEYNALTGKAITRFSTRAAGEQQLARARLATGIAIAPVPDEVVISSKACPQCKADSHVKMVGGSGKKFRCEACNVAFKIGGKVMPNPSVLSEARSIGIRRSWDVLEVYEKRRVRDNVEVAGHGQFRSVRAAFMKLELPLQGHIKFRMELKDKKEAEFSGYKFKIINN